MPALTLDQLDDGLLMIGPVEVGCNDFNRSHARARSSRRQILGQQEPVAVREAVPPVQRDRPVIASLDFQVQDADALLGARVLDELQRGGAQPATSMRAGNEELVDEGVTAAVLEAIAEGQDHVPDNNRPVGGHPDAPERGLAEETGQDRAGFGLEEWIATFGVERPLQNQNRFCIRRAGCSKAGDH
jgi:hypothetical protein